MRIRATRFLRAACRPEDEPQAAGPEVVFLGRSNVGKSSLINRLLGVKGLARTSSQPGRTQSVNFYRVNESCCFVDLPGYGYAKVPEAVRRSWGPMVEGFLERHRERIALGLLIVDSRLPATELDRTMHAWLEAREIPYVVVATKTDKLKASKRQVSLRDLTSGFGAFGVADRPVVVSARTGLGIKELWRHLDVALEARTRS